MIDRYEYSLFFSLEMKVLCNLYFEEIHNPIFRNKIVKYIKSKQSKNIESIPINFKQKLLDTFKISNGRKRIAIGSTIKELKEFFDKKLLITFFDCQIDSSLISDRKRAYEVSNLIYDNNIENLLWNAWDKYHDNNCLKVLAKRSDIEKLSQKFEEIWETKDILYIKNYILRRVSLHDFSKIHVLKDKYPVSFLAACVTAKLELSDDEAILLATKSRSLDEFSYSLWCLGALGKTKAIIELLSQTKEIENEIPNKYWNQYGEETEFIGILT